MATRRPTTIAAYIQAAPRAGQPHLRRLYAILKSIAPKAGEEIKWGSPFFVEPRFLFAFSAHKAHLSLAVSPSTLEHFRKELEGHPTTRNFFKVPYDQPLPEALVRNLARHQLGTVRARKSDTFW